MTRTQFMHFAFLLATCAAAQACAVPSERSVPMAQAAECRARVLVSFRAPADASVVAAVAAATAVRLAVVERLLPDLFVLDLAARDPDPSCTAALARLGADARVRTAEQDARRRANGA